MALGAEYGPNARGGDPARGISIGAYLNRFLVKASMFTIDSGSGNAPDNMFDYPTPHGSYTHHSTVTQDSFGMSLSLGYKPLEKNNFFLHGTVLIAEAGATFDVKQSTATGWYYRHNRTSERDISAAAGVGATYYKYGTPLALGIEYDQIRGIVGSFSWVYWRTSS